MIMKQLHCSARMGALFACLSIAGAAWAATDTTTFQVTATVNDACDVSATDLAFGIYDPNAAGANNATSIVTATCTIGTSYDIGLDTGANGASASGTTRAMTNATDFLDYELYTNSARTNVWGNADPNRVSGIAILGGNDHTVFGQIPAGQFVGAGSYTDTINVTIEF